MSTLSRLKVWIAGDVLTAADLNNEFNNIINDYNGSIDADNLGTIQNLVLSNSTTTNTVDVTSTSTGAAYIVRNGGVAYSVTGTGLIDFSGSNTPGWVSNMGLDLTSGVLKIVDVDGNDLSSTNPAWVTIPSSTNGLSKCFKITSSFSFEDASGTSDIIGQEFDCDTGVVWDESRPFYLYFCDADGTDANVFAFISPDPTWKTTPSSATNIGYHGNPATGNNKSDIFALTATNITAYTSRPCVRVGSFTMTMDASDDWTVDTLTSNDGIGKFQKSRVFTVPENQHGAASGTHFWANGGTAPTYGSLSTAQYTLDPDTGMCFLDCAFRNTSGGTAGASAVTLIFGLPYSANYTAFDRWGGIMGWLENSGSLDTIIIGRFSAGTSKLVFEYQSTIATALSTVQNSNQSATARNMNFQGWFKAF